MAKARPSFAADGIGMPPPPGQILSPFNQARLKLTDAQRQQLKSLQGDTDRRLETILTKQQQKQLKDLQPRVFGPPRGIPQGGPGGFFNFGPPAAADYFGHAANYPGLAGRVLAPGKTLEEMRKSKK